MREALRYFEQLSWLDSFYSSAQTVTTVGYGDLAPKTVGGRIFAILLMLTGVGTVLFGLTILAQAVIQSEMVEALSHRRKLKEMEKLEGHYIVCGAGRVGRRIIRSLERQGLAYVVIENNPAKLSELDSASSHTIIGDATSEENLIKAGVKRARGLASCLPDDRPTFMSSYRPAALVLIFILSPEQSKSRQNRHLFVPEQAVLLLRRSSAANLWRALLRPAIADFMDSIVAETLDLVFEEVAIEPASPYAGKYLKDTNIMSELSLIVVATRRKDGELEFHPNGDTIINGGDLLIVIGKAESVQRLVEANK